MTLMHFIKGNIGCGMLAMGEAFKFGGLYLTLVILLYVWSISVYNMHILVSFQIEYNFKNNICLYIVTYIILNLFIDGLE